MGQFFERFLFGKNMNHWKGFSIGFAIGNPIFGDTKYKLSNSNKGINKNLMLHSYQIKFKINEIKYTYSALLPDYFKKLLKSKRISFSSLK